MLYIDGVIMSLRKMFSLQEKCEIVEQIGKGVSVPSLAKTYGVAKSRTRTI